MSARGPRAALPFALLFVGACAAVAGLDDFTIVGDTPPVNDGGVLADGSASSSASSTSSSSSASSSSGNPIEPVLDAGPVDSGVDAGTCARKGFLPSAASTAFAAKSPIVVDGNLGDWPACDFVTVDTSNAGQVLGTPLSSAQFAVAWNDAGIYFACNVADPHPEGSATIDPFQNDACELYLGISPTSNGSYAPGDVHLIVDYKGLARVYSGSGPGGGLSPSSSAHATVTPTGFVVEAFIASGELLGNLATNQTLRFDVEIDDNQNGVLETGVLIGYRNVPLGSGSYAECSSADKDEPACDTRLWGALNLLP